MQNNRIFDIVHRFQNDGYGTSLTRRVYMYVGLNGDIYNYVWTSVYVHGPEW